MAEQVSLSFKESAVIWDGLKSIPLEDNRVLIYCNGIMNSINDAEESGRLISKVFGNKIVTICYNPTSGVQFLLQAANKVQQQAELAFSVFLRRVICEALGVNSQVILFAHSHGAFISLQALENELIQEQRDRIHVYTLGGVAMIPKSLAARVENYVCDLDYFATPIGSMFRGNTLGIVNSALLVWGGINNDHPLLKSLPRIDSNRVFLKFQRELLRNRTLLELFIHLEAGRTPEVDGDVKKAMRQYLIARMGNPAITLNEESEEASLERTENRKNLYLKCFNEYNIFFTNGFPSNTEIVAEGALWVALTVTSFFITSYENHKLANYKVALETIAEEYS